MTLKRLLLTAVAAVIGLTAAATSLDAQVQGIGLGPKVGLYLDGNLIMVGGTMEIPFSSEITLEPDVELVFGVLNQTRIVADLNARYSFPLLGLSVSPFILAGAGIVDDIYKSLNNQPSTSKTYLRGNVGGGVTFSTRDEIQPWGGLKVHFGTNGDSDVLLQGGVNFYF